MSETHYSVNQPEVVAVVSQNSNPNPVPFGFPRCDLRELDQTPPRFEISPAFSFPLHLSSDILSAANSAELLCFIYS